MSTTKQKGYYSTIRLTKRTHERLARLGTLADSFDSVIAKLLDEYEENQTRRSKK